VVLAFLADDLRESRADRVTERRALELVVRDLRQDSLELERYARNLESRQRDAASFLNMLSDDEVLPDSIVVRRYQAVGREFNYRPTGPAFEGLRDSGGLSLITDPAVADALLGYYDSQHRYLDDLREAEKDALATFRDLGLKHVTVLPRDDGNFLYAAGDPSPAVLLSSLGEMRSDRRFRASIGQLGEARSHLARRIHERFLTSLAEAVTAVEGHLAR
jgi:hypothetical protein